MKQERRGTKDELKRHRGRRHKKKRREDIKCASKRRPEIANKREGVVESC